MAMIDGARMTDCNFCQYRNWVDFSASVATPKYFCFCTNEESKCFKKHVEPLIGERYKGESVGWVVEGARKWDEKGG